MRDMLAVLTPIVWVGVSVYFIADLVQVSLMFAAMPVVAAGWAFLTSIVMRSQ